MIQNLNGAEESYHYWCEEIAKSVDKRNGLIFGYHHDKVAYAEWERGLCELFLSGAETDRKRIGVFVNDPHVLWLLNGSPLLVSKELRNSQDEHTVMLGLAALLIVDGYVELREADYSMRTLIAAATKAGIKLQPLLAAAKAMALRSSTRDWLEQWTAVVATQKVVMK